MRRACAAAVPDRPASAPALELDGVAVRLGGRTVIEGLDWSMEDGEFVGLLGPNGAGKTTMLRSVLGLVPLAAGTVRIGGRPPRAARTGIGYVPQKHHFAWDFPLTVEDAVMSGRVRRIGWFRRPGASDWREVRRALDRTGLTGLRTRPVDQLSGGQRQRVLLARVLANEPRVLLLDEPFTGVDAPTQDMLTGLYRDLAADGIGILMSTHDVPGALESCTRILGLRTDVAFDAAPEDLTADRVLAWLRGRALPPAVPASVDPVAATGAALGSAAGAEPSARAVSASEGPTTSSSSGPAASSPSHRAPEEAAR